MSKKIFIFIVLVVFTSNKVIAENKYEIIININNQIITNFDIEKETQYLLALSPSLDNLSKKQIKEISKNSLIREKIKENEILKYYKINYEDPQLLTFLSNIYNRLNMKNEDEFAAYLLKNDLYIKEVIKKIAKEKAWALIFDKFNDLISVYAVKKK